jgi:hypothetical protein
VRLIDEEPDERHLLAALLPADEVLHGTLDRFVLLDLARFHAFGEELLADDADNEAPDTLAPRRVRIAADVEHGDPAADGEIADGCSVLGEEPPTPRCLEEVLGEHLDVFGSVYRGDPLEDTLERRLILGDTVDERSGFGERIDAKYARPALSVEFGYRHAERSVDRKALLAHLFEFAFGYEDVRRSPHRSDPIPIRGRDPDGSDTSSSRIRPWYRR